MQVWLEARDRPVLLRTRGGIELVGADFFIDFACAPRRFYAQLFLQCGGAALKLTNGAGAVARQVLHPHHADVAALAYLIAVEQALAIGDPRVVVAVQDRKSTRLNS